MHRFIGVLGMLALLGFAYAYSTDRRAIRYKTVAWGLGLQIAFAFLIMRWEFGRLLFERFGAAVNWLLDFAYYGTSFVFGDVGQKNSPRGFYFAFQALPTIIFVAALFAVLYYLGIMQVVVKAAARVMTGLMGTSGAESLNVAASVFVGQTEAPLTIRPFLPEVTRSELMTIMTSGMAHVSGGMMAAFDFDDSIIYDEAALPYARRKIPMLPLMREEALETFRAWEQKADTMPYQDQPCGRQVGVYTYRSQWVRPAKF